jgi:AAA+ ATPase superfamily predicted ATPase
MQKLIGRKEEQAALLRCMESPRAEFVVVYGRRRVGKTFLVRHFFAEKYAFSYVGIRGIKQQQQLEAFATALQQYGKTAFAPVLADWFAAFDALRQLLERSKAKGGKKVVFIDEMPWMDRAKSDFVSALEHFWNGWAAQRDDILLIACGSATSWIAEKLIYNTGGLHNRITSRIYLRAFTLCEVEEYLLSQGIEWDRLQVAQCYMTMGGVPYYLSMLRKGESLAQAVDRLCFSKNAELREEFQELYASLFRQPENYVDVVRALAEQRSGLSRQELSQRTGMTGSGLTRVLANLERCDFIVGYSRFGSKKNNTVYRLADFYSLFFLRFIEGDRSHDQQWWQHHLMSPTVAAWQGLSFELLCLLHLRQLKQALGIGGIAVSASTWRSSDQEHPYQIDLLLDRADRLINLCEMKFSSERYIIDRDYEQRLRDRQALFRTQTHTRKSLVTTLVTTFGVMPGRHSGVVQSEVTLDDLFAQ